MREHEREREIFVSIQTADRLWIWFKTTREYKAAVKAKRKHMVMWNEVVVALLKRVRA